MQNAVGLYAQAREAKRDRQIILDDLRRRAASARMWRDKVEANTPDWYRFDGVVQELESILCVLDVDPKSRVFHHKV